jgi:nicotinamide riboside kinase
MISILAKYKKGASFMKRIAFTGAHSSGKSTLIKAFCCSRREEVVSVIEGLSRAIIKRGFPLAKDSTVDSYANYIRDQLQITPIF